MLSKFKQIGNLGVSALSALYLAPFGLAASLVFSPISHAQTPASFVTPPSQVEGEPLADLIAQVSPAVVNIKVITGGAAAGHPNQDAVEGQGSGFIVTSDGKVVTNHHVIEGGDKITVDFATGEVYPAKVIGTDRETDLAVIQIQAKRKFKYVKFHHGEKVRIGDWVLAIGNPFGIGQSSSVGIISAIGRERVDSGSFIDYMQTDATVNRGNSGGPLFNFAGDVVGVNSAIYSPTGASVGIAFVIPHDLAEEIAAELIVKGKIDRGFLGVGLREAEFSRAGKIFDGGATIETIGANSPADRAGLKVEDVIKKINNRQVRNATEATRLIASLRAGDKAIFAIERHDNMIPGGVRVIIGKRPEDEDELHRATGNLNNASANATSAPPPPTADSLYNTGLSLVDLSATFRDTIGMRPDQVGVYVDSVAQGSNAALKGIKSGMVILEANGGPVASVYSFGETVRKAIKKGQRSLVLLVRTINGSETYTSISLN